MPSVASISQQIWDMKYRLKGPDGAALDKTIEDTWRRVAAALAAPEADTARAAWAERFYGALENFRFLPAGRVVAGAGSGRNVTLFNCFVMGAIPDDMSGIFTHLREAALTMQQGGGIGYDFSTLRPKGAPVKGVGADASGPLSFMDVWDAMCRTIMSAGYRRGAMMGTLRCDHPDVEAFIEAKREPGRLRMFNLSVLVTDAFMAAVKEGAPWELKFAGTTYKVLPARELWDKIMRATYAYAEPGVIFIDRINRRNNLHYCEEIHATNPCVTGETWVQTSEGPRQVMQLLDRAFTAIVDGQPHHSGREGFFPTGVKPVYRLLTREGYTLRLTGDHKVLTAASRARSTIRREWRRADSLSPGDLVVLNDHGRSAAWPGTHDGQRGTSVGYLVGRRFAALYGRERQSETVPLAVIGSRATALPLPRAGEGRGEGVSPALPAAAEPASSSPHPALSRTRERVQNARSPSEERADTAAGRLGFEMLAGDISPALEKTSSAFYCGFLAGIFDAAASVDERRGGPRIALIRGRGETLVALQRMLLRLGILSEVDNRTLVISGSGAHRFAGSVLAGALNAATDTTKRVRLFAALAGLFSPGERFVAEVASVEPDSEAAVYDAQIPGINAFDANGLYAHNCGEQPLPPYGACLLGSINLASLVLDPFETTARLDLAELARLVPLAVRMMDNVVDVSRFPLDQQTHEAKAKRRIGLGVTGLGDALILCGVRYGAAPAVALTESWMKAIRREAYLASAALAAEKGAFPLFDRDAYLAGELVAELDDDVRAAIAQHGIRNALLTSIAPTGTISIFADNVSSGLEPVFSFRYTRNVLMPDGSRKEEEVADYALRLHQRLKGEDAALPDSFVDAQSLAPGDHLVMQAAVQKYIDSSISKTINLPADIAFDSFKDIYLQAYALGCKGCTTYRPNEVTGAVLEVRKEAERPSEAPPIPAVAAREPELPLPSPMPKHADIFEAGGVVYMTQPLSRPESLPGQTYKIKWPDGDHAIYITVNDVIQDGRRRPFEIFINSKNMEHYAWTVGLTRMISAVFRRGGDVSFVVEELKAVFDPRGGAWMGGKYVPSLLAAIGDVIERHMIDIGFIAPRGTTAKAEAARQVVNLPTAGATAARMSQCPKCGEASLIRVEGCDQCTSCGYSKCG